MIVMESAIQCFLFFVFNAQIVFLRTGTLDWLAVLVVSWTFSNTVPHIYTLLSS